MLTQKEKSEKGQGRIKGQKEHESLPEDEEDRLAIRLACAATRQTVSREMLNSIKHFH